MKDTIFESGVEVPTWLQGLASAVVEHIHGVDILAPLGCHCYHNRARDEFELTLFASRTQVVGGRLDGREVGCNFDVRINDMMDLFDAPPRVGWQALPKGNEDQIGGHVSFEGEYMGQAVWLRILSSSPEQFEHGRDLNVHSLKLEDLW